MSRQPGRGGAVSHAHQNARFMRVPVPGSWSTQDSSSTRMISGTNKITSGTCLDGQRTLALRSCRRRRSSHPQGCSDDIGERRVPNVRSVDESEIILHEAGETIRLLFTDVQMPPSEHTGFELARHCADGWRHISIIVASGAVQPQNKEMPSSAK